MQLGSGWDTVNIIANDWSYHPQLSFHVEDFSEGDVVKFDSPAYFIEINDDGIIVNYDVSIGGVRISTEEKDTWHLDENTHIATYGDYTTAGNARLSEDSLSASYEEIAANEDIKIEIQGISDTVGMEPVDKRINLSEENLVANGATITSNIGEYSIALNGDFNGKSLTGSNGKDTIFNSGSNVEIDTRNDDDKVYNSGQHVTISMGDGDDHVGNTESYATIYGGDGKDSIYNADGENVFIDAGDADDYVYNEDSFTTIDTGEGDDTIENKEAPYSYATQISIEAGNGKDSIYNESSNLTISAGSGKDTIKNYGNEVTLNGAEDDDLIITYGSNIYINSSDDNGNNTIDNGIYIDNDQGVLDPMLKSAVVYGSGATMEVGDGDNLINNIGDNVSIVTGNGDNTIFSGFYDTSLENLLEYMLNGQNFLADYFLKLSDDIVIGGENIEIETGNGDNTIVIRSSYNKVTSGSGNDKIFSSEGTYNNIDSGDGNDDILIYKDTHSLILGGNGNDNIIINRFSTKNMTDFNRFVFQQVVDKLLSTGIDLIAKNATFAKLVDSYLPYWAAFKLGWDIGSAVRDYRNGRKYLDEFFSSESDIVGGKGDDNIILDALAPRKYHYSLGDGNDVIYGFSNQFISDAVSLVIMKKIPFSTLIVESGDINSVKVQESDVIVNIGTGSVKLADGTKSKFNLQESNGKLTTRAYERDSDTGEVICSIFGGENELVEATLGDRYVLYDSFGGNNTIHGGDKNDIVHAENGNVTINAGKGNDTIYSATDLTGLKTSLIRYAAGDGNDIIRYLTSHDTIELTSGKIDKAEIIPDAFLDVNDLVLTIDTGSITIVDYGDAAHGSGFINIKNSDGTLTKHRYAIDANSKNVVATLIGSSGDTSIIGSDGGDDLHGCNTLSEAGNTTILGGKGRDTLTATSMSTTLIGGKDDDIIYTKANNVVVYKVGDGNDTVYDFGLGGGRKLRLLGISSPYETVRSGQDVIINIEQGSIRLVGAYGTDIKIENYSSTPTGGDDTPSGGTDTPSGGTDTPSGGSVIIIPTGAWAVVHSADGTQNAVYADSTVANGTSFNDTIKIAALTSGGSRVINGNGGNDSVAIFGVEQDWSDGIDNYSNVTINGGAGQDTVDIYGNNFAIRDATVSIDGGADDDYIHTTGKENNVAIFNSAVTLNGGTGNDTIEVGNKINEGAVAVYAQSSLKIYGGEGDDKVTVNGGIQESSATIDGGTGNNEFNFINNQYSSFYSVTSGVISSGDGDDTINFYSGGNNAILCSTLSADVGNGNNLVSIKANDNAIVNSTFTIKSGAGTDTINLNGNTYHGISQSTGTINTGAGNDLLNITTNTYSGIYQSTVSIDVSDGDDTISIYGKGSIGINQSEVTINGGVGNDEINIAGNGGIYYSTVTASGGAGADTINVSAEGIDGSMYSRYLLDGGDEADYINIGLAAAQQ